MAETTKRGLLICGDGVDSSGKATQMDLLYKRLLEDGIRVKKISFPVYGSMSSALVKMYLGGEFGTSPDDVNAYAASLFYEVDRFASYKTSWEEFYLSGGIIICDRYVTSNMIHQAGKINDVGKKNEFLTWLLDLAYNKIGLPVPDLTLFLDMPPEFGVALMKDRNNKITGGQKKDIHECNFEFLKSSYLNACDIADQYNWSRISCVKDNKVRSIEDIHSEVYSMAKNMLQLYM